MLTEGNRYPFTTLREEMHLLSAIAHSETRLPCLLWNHDRTVLQVDGSPLIIGAIRHMASSLLDRARNIITSLCEGVDMSAYDECLKSRLDPHNPTLWPKDPLRETAHGYSFIQDPNNPFLAFRDVLLKNFHDDSDIFDKYHVRVESKVVFKQGQSDSWDVSSHSNICS